MKSTFYAALASLLLTNTNIRASEFTLNVPNEHIHNINFPTNFSIKNLYKEQNVVVFKTEEIIFAQGKFNKKFSLKTPYGKTFSVSRIYELVPDKRPLLVVRDGIGAVLGFIHIQNHRRSELFKPLKTTVYDKEGTPLLSGYYPLNSKYCRFFSLRINEGDLFAYTKKGKEDSFNVELSPSYHEFGIDHTLLLSVFQIHASKDLLTKLDDYIAIDEININELAAYAAQTITGEKVAKSVDLENKVSTTGSEHNDWLYLKNLLENTTEQKNLSVNEIDNIATSLTERFEKENNLGPKTIEEALYLLSEEEKAVLLTIIDSRVSD